MSNFLLRLARRGAGLPANPAAISVAPAAVFPAAPLAPAGLDADASADSLFVASNDEPTTQLPRSSQSVASPPAPYRRDGVATVLNVESAITPEQTAAASPLEISAKEIRSEPRREAHGAPFPPEIGAPPINPGIDHSLPSFPAASISPKPLLVTRDEFKEDIPAVVRPTPPAHREQFALSRAREISRPAETTPAPIHVRIGRIEVRGASAPTPQAPRKAAPPAPSGFASYLRLRTYRNWPR